MNLPQVAQHNYWSPVESGIVGDDWWWIMASSVGPRNDAAMKQRRGETATGGWSVQWGGWHDDMCHQSPDYTTVAQLLIVQQCTTIESVVLYIHDYCQSPACSSFRNYFTSYLNTRGFTRWENLYGNCTGHTSPPPVQFLKSARKEITYIYHISILE